MSCPQCGAKYQYDESRFGESLSKRLKCSKCERVFEVHRPTAGGEPERPEAPAPRKKVEDTTRQFGVGRLRPEDLESLPELTPLAGDRRYSLAVILGVDAGQIFPVNKPRVVLGRGAGCDVQLQDSEISRKHAMLEIDEDAATLVDLQSTNGTFVEGNRIERAKVESQGEFTIGTTTLMFIVTQMHEVH